MNAGAALDPGVGYVVAIALALLFAHAAWHKLRTLAHFREQLAAYRLVPGPLLGLTAVVVPVCESLVALLLPVSASRPWAAGAGAVLLLAYAVAMAINLARGRRDLDCGCTGPAGRRPIAAWMVWRNALFALLLLACSRPWAARELGGTDLVTIGGGLAALVLLYAALDLMFGKIMPRSAVLRGAR